MADDETSPTDQKKLSTELEALLDVNVEISAVLGTATMPIAQILKLGRGAVVELDRAVEEDIEIHANNRLVAHGEVVVVDGNLGVNLTKIVQLSGFTALASNETKDAKQLKDNIDTATTDDLENTADVPVSNSEET